MEFRWELRQSHMSGVGDDLCHEGRRVGPPAVTFVTRCWRHPAGIAKVVRE